MSGEFASPAMIGVAISTIIFIVAILAIFILRRTGKRRRTVLLIGLSDAGKTLMYSRLLTGEPLHTYTSMTENVCADVIIDEDGRMPPLTLVDIPGEDRIRKSAISKWLEDSFSQIIGIVCVIDSVSFTKQARDVTELIYDVLISKSQNCPLLIACNKQDSVQAKSSNLIKNTLAKELSLLNKSRSASLEMTGSGKSKKAHLDIAGNEFDWANDSKNTTFIEVQCKQQLNDTNPDQESNDDCVKRVRSWIAYLK